MAISFDYLDFFKKVNGQIKKDIGLTVVSESSIDKQNGFPFITFSVVNPHKDLGRTNAVSVYFDIYVNYTAHSNNELEALTVGDKLRNWFKSANTHYYLGEESGIFLVKLSDNMVINNLMSIGYDFRNQFTAVFRVNAPTINTGMTSIEKVMPPAEQEI